MNILKVVFLWLIVSFAQAQVVTVTDDLAARIEDTKGVVQLGRGVYQLKRAVSVPKGVKIDGIGGYANSGEGTEIRQAFDGDWMLRWTGSGGISNLSLTVGPNKRVGAAIFLDGTKSDARPTWFQITNVVVPKYSNQPAFKTGLLADGSAWTTPGSQGVRDITAIGFYAYGCERAIDFRRVVNVAIVGGSCGPAGDGRAKMRFTDCDSIHVGQHTLWGDLTVERCKNVSWMGGRLDGFTESASEAVVVMPCNKPGKASQ